MTGRFWGVLPRCLAATFALVSGVKTLPALAEYDAYHLDTITVSPMDGLYDDGPTRSEISLDFAQMTGGAPIIRPPGEGPRGGLFERNRPDEDFEGNPDCQEGKTGQPVVLMSGNKIKEEIDFASAGIVPLRLVRTYNKSWTGTGLFGKNWISTFDYKLSFEYANGQVCYKDPGEPKTCDPPSGLTKIFVHRPDGARFTYTWNVDRSRWDDQKPDSVAWLENKPDGTWAHYTEDNSTEVYSANGEVLSVIDQYGIGWTFQYIQPYLLQTATHTSGRTVTFGWTGSVVTVVTDPAGNSYTYSYGPNGLLSGVVYPANTGTRTYHYEDSAQPSALTGISVDGVRYSNYSYYPDGKVQASGLANGVDRSTFAYLYDGQMTEVTNAKGAKSTYTFHRYLNGKRIRYVTRTGVTNCPTLYDEYEYDAYGYLKVAHHRNGSRTVYDRNAKGQAYRITAGVLDADPSKQRITTIDWNPSINRIDAIRTYGASPQEPITETIYTYHPFDAPEKGRIQSVTARNKTPYGEYDQARVSTYSYVMHPNGLPAEVVIDGPLPGGDDIVRTAYDSFGQLVSTTNALGQATRYEQHNGLGLPRYVTDPNGFTTEYEYDARGRVKKERRTIAGQLHETTYTYNGLDKVVSIARTGLDTIVNKYDAAGRLTQRSLGVDDERYTHDLLGNVTGVSRVRREYYQECVRGNRYEPCEWVTRVRETVYYSQAIDRDEIGRITAVRGNNLQNAAYTYYNTDLVNTVTDAAGRTTTYTYTVHDELESVRDPTNSVTAYTYDAAGNRSTVTDPRGLTTTYRFDGLGQLITLDSPDTGLTTFDYDDAGRMESALRADATLIAYTYDLLNRRKTASSGGQTMTWTYDSCSYGVGKLCGVLDSSGTINYSYKPWGQLAQQASDIGGATYTVLWNYDNNQRLTELTYPSGVKVTYGYDRSSRVTSVNAIVAGITRSVASAFSYYPFGPRNTFTYGNTIVRGTTYDLDYRQRTAAATGVQNLSFDYYATDEVKTIADSLNASLTQVFSYDGAGRLASVTAGVGNQTWAYDDTGNRDAHTWNGATDVYVTDPYSNRVASIQGPSAKSYTFDLLGNVEQVTSGSYALMLVYDPFNRVESVTNGGVTTAYSVNALNQRVRKEGPGGVFGYIYSPEGPLLSETVPNSAAIASDYIWLGSEPIAVVRTGLVYYIHADQVNRPAVVTNQAKSVVWRASNLPFDRTVTTDTFGSLNLGFPGQYYDAESGLYYNWNRYYDPATGRYLQSDPIGLQGGLNTYSYTGNNPVSGIDPTGLDTIGLGLQVNGQVFGALSGSLSVTVSWGGSGIRLGYLASGSPMTMASTAMGGSVGVVGTYSKADCPEQLSGWGGTFGGSFAAGPAIGVNVSNVNAQAPQAYSGFLGWGVVTNPFYAGAPFEVHAGASYTTAGSVRVWP